MLMCVASDIALAIFVIAKFVVFITASGSPGAKAVVHPIRSYRPRKPLTDFFIENHYSATPVDPFPKQKSLQALMPVQILKKRSIS
jgi:hypothetical protein